MAGDATSATEIVPKQLFEQLENAVMFSTSDNPPINDTIYLRLGEGFMVTAGRGKYAAGIDTRPVESVDPEVAEVIMDPEEVMTFVREAKKIKGFGGKTARVSLKVSPQSLAVSFGNEHFELGRSELADEVETTEEFEGIYDHLFRMIAENRSWDVPQRIVVLRKMFKLLDKIKTGATAKDEDPFAFLSRPEGSFGNGLLTVRVGPVRVYQVAAEVD